ncbi:hypothetical protein BDF21DRAFT_248848 [Thamnidium elegans]|nr:hypothetical protein BDF21DRAFT_248848 [Thamnidium elegans]
MRELANRESDNNADERNIAPVARRNSQQRNFEPRARGNIRQDQYDPYENNRNVSPPRYQQQAPPPPHPPRRGRNNDRNNDYRPDYGRNNNDYPYAGNNNNNNNNNNGNNNNNNGRNQDYNNRQQDNGRSYRPAPYRYNNNNNEPINDVRPYNGRYNEPVNSYTPRYNNNDDDRSYPRYNEAAEPRNAYNRYNDSSRYNDTSARSPVARNYTAINPSLPPASPLIPSRQGNDVPIVQIVAWDNVAYGFTDYIERVFSSNQIRASSITLPYSKSAREEIVKQMILEGVKAIVMIDRNNELQSKIYLQVFAPAEHGQGVRYDEYDSVTAIEAVSIIRRSYPAPIAQPPVAAPPAIDMNTLASLYNMIQPKPSGSVVSPPVTNQPTIPQLLATLVNGLNVSSSPQPPQPLQPEQPNIAALISTAANGNPALAQLLAQMTSNSSMSYSPSMPHVEPTLGYPSTEQQQK